MQLANATKPDLTQATLRGTLGGIAAQKSIRRTANRLETSKSAAATGCLRCVRAGFFFGMRRSIDRFAYDADRGLLFNSSVRNIGQVADSRPPPPCFPALIHAFLASVIRQSPALIPASCHVLAAARPVKARLAHCAPDRGLGKGRSAVRPCAAVLLLQTNICPWDELDGTHCVCCFFSLFRVQLVPCKLG